MYSLSHELLVVKSNPAWRLYLSAFMLMMPFFDVPPTPINGIAVSGFLALPILIATPCKNGARIYYKGLVLFLLFISWYTFSALINLGHLAEKAPNHIAYYLLTFLIYYVGFSYAFDFLGIRRIQKLLYYGLVFVVAIGTIEVSLYFLAGFQAYANFLDHGQNVGTFSSFFPRMRSTFNEPSHLAIYVIGIAPIIWNYNKISKFIVLYTLIWTFSSSAAFGIALALIVYSLWSIARNIGSVKILNVFIFAIILGFILFYAAGTSIFQKIIDIEQVQPVRYFAFVDSIPYIAASPLLGHGPAYYYTYAEFGLFNLYLQLLVESGIIGLILFLAFIFSHLKFVCMSRMLFIGFFSLFFQYIGMNHYYIPGLWLLLVYSVKCQCSCVTGDQRSTQRRSEATPAQP